MKEVTWVDQGTQEGLHINGVFVDKIDRMSKRRFLEMLEKHGILKLNIVTFDQFEQTK